MARMQERVRSGQGANRLHGIEIASASCVQSLCREVSKPVCITGGGSPQLDRWRLLLLVAVAWGVAGCRNADPPGSGITLMDGSSLSFDAGAEPATWENFALPFFESYCVGCHAAFRNYTTREHVSRDAYFIRCGVSPEPLVFCPPDTPLARQYPYGDGPFPEDTEREHMIEWFDRGMP